MINTPRKLLSLSAAWLLSVPFMAFSSEQDLFTLSFEELLDVNINLATKTDETRASVPSSTTVFTHQHIALLGVNNVYDLMNYVPGFQSTRGDWVGAVPKEHTRGVFLNSGNVLVMINGQRLNEASFGKASVYMPHISVDIVDKVEFIRGPGSALYGSNAFLGVMNIITFQARNQMSVGIGEHGYTQVAGSFIKTFLNKQRCMEMYLGKDKMERNIHRVSEIHSPATFWNLAHNGKILTYRFGTTKHS